MSTDQRFGAGHVARCRALAAAIGEPITLFHDPGTGLGEVRWTAAAVAESSLDSASEAIKALRIGTIDALVVDSYAIGNAEIREAVAHGMVAAFRDGAPYGPETLTIDPSPGSAAHASVLAGPGYMPLATPPGQRTRQACGLSAHSPPAILVAFGARDSANCTFTALEAIGRLSRLSAVTAALPPDAPHAGSVARKIEAMPSASLLRDVGSLSDCYDGFDLAVGAPGVSQFERAYCGLPSILVAQNEKQVRLVEAWQQTGAATCCAHAADAITETLTMLLDDPDRLEDMCRRGRTLVDGTGAKRLADALKSRIVA